MVTHADAAQVEVTFNLKNGSFRQVFRPDQMVEGVALRTGDLVTAFCAAYIREQSIPASEVSLETTEIREFANFKHGLSGVIRL